MMKVLSFFLFSALAAFVAAHPPHQDDVAFAGGILGMGFAKKFKFAPDGVSKEEIKCTPREFKRINHEIFMVIAQQAGFPKEEATNPESWSTMKDVELELDVIEAGCVSDFTNIHGSDVLVDYFRTLDNGFQSKDIICPTQMEYTCYDDSAESVEEAEDDSEEDDETRKRRRARLTQGVKDVSMLPEDYQKTRDLQGCYNCQGIHIDWTQCIGCYRRRQLEEERGHKGRNLLRKQAGQHQRQLTEVELDSIKTVGIALCEQINDPDMGHSGIPCVDCDSFKVWVESD